MAGDGFLSFAPTAADDLGPEERTRYLFHARRLERTTRWEGARGVEVTNEMISTVTAHAALLAAGFESNTNPYLNVVAVIFHQGTIVSHQERVGPVRGVVDDTPQHLAGQSWHGRGPLLFDWLTVRRHVAAPERGSNVIYHEFAHKLDQLTGAADGMPPLPDRGARALWNQTIGTNFRRLQRRGGDGLVRIYAATSPAEYFAVTTELFFTRPEELNARLPRVYRRLAEFYHQDPVALSACRAPTPN